MDADGGSAVILLRRRVIARGKQMSLIKEYSVINIFLMFSFYVILPFIFKLKQGGRKKQWSN